MIYIKRNIDIEISVTPDELAVLFSCMSSLEQAQFFNATAQAMQKWDTPYIFQLESITQEKTLTNDARVLMDMIGEYSVKR